MKVDFAFWTGKRLIAIEIDGGSHIGSESHVEKDRLLQRSDVFVIHILNNEIGKYGTKVIERLLPAEITEFWKSAEGQWRSNPLGLPF
jgi:very-short-patch-repair endonuclease